MKKLFTVLLAVALVLSFFLVEGSTAAHAEEATPVWEKTYYTDVFGDPTDEWYITNTELFSGTFKNSATDGSPLSAKILVDLDSVSIVLYEYGKDRIKNALSNDVIYNIAIKTVSGEKAAVVGTLKSGGDRIIIDERLRPIFLAALYEKGIISIYIEHANQNLNNYLFKAEGGNFAELLSEEFYQMAIQGRKDKKYETAISLFVTLGDFKDSKEQISITYYTQAEDYRDKGNYNEAIAVFEKLGDYKDSKEQVSITIEMRNARDYANAESLREKGDYGKAIATFAALGDYRDSQEQVLQTQQLGYAEAEALLAEGKKAHAAIVFGKIIGYKDSRERSLALWDQVAKRDSIAAGGSFVVALRTDGTVLTTKYRGEAKYYYGQCDVESWTDIVAVSAGYSHTIGLRSNGTVVAAGSNDSGECDVSGWTDIVAVEAGAGGFTLGLKADGTVVAVGRNYEGQCNVNGWSDIISLAAGSDHTIGIKTDGTAVSTKYDSSDSMAKMRDKGQYNVRSWSEIVSVDADTWNTVGLKSDGTVIVAGDNCCGQCEVSEWRNIVTIANGDHHTVGLRSDGTVVATDYIMQSQYDHYDGQCDVGNWSNIVEIAAYGNYTIGLRADGTIVATGENVDGRCEVYDLTGIIVPK